MKKISPFFIIREVTLGVVQAFIWLAVGALIVFAFIYKYQTPDVTDLAKLKQNETTVILDRTGRHVLYEIHGEENRQVVPGDDIPSVVRQAVIAAEDKTFYNHFGFSISSIIRAAKADFKDGELTQGGSTITQQLARNIYLSRKKTIERKIQEILLAVKIERNLSKDQILNLYLNNIPFGANAYGIAAASKIYFGKEPRDLTLDEAAVLAALPRAPTFYCPYGNNRAEINARKKLILGSMASLGYISADEARRSGEIDTLAKVLPFQNRIEAPHFVFYVLEKLEQKYGRGFLETGGLKVITTLDYDLQKEAEESIREGAEKNIEKGATNAALLAIDPKSGDILAMVGSRDYFDTSVDGQVNVAVEPRQPGSSFKPIVYATAFEKGYEPETKITDARTNFGPDGSGKPYIPRNYDGKYHGTVMMRQALAMSLNIPAVKTLAMVGLDAVRDMARRLGISTISDQRNYGLSMAIGGAEVKLIDMVSAFSTFANNGNRNEPQAIKEISDNQSGAIYQEENLPKLVIDPEVARKINSILSDNQARTPIFGKNSPLNYEGRYVAAKTGTTQDFKDAWTVGYATSIAAGVWAGNNNGDLMKQGSDGVFVAAPIWRSFMDKALERYPNEAFVPYTPKYIPVKQFPPAENKKSDNSKDHHHN